jgi:hypothetical protein
MGWSFVYLGLCRLFQLVVLLCRSERVGCIYSNFLQIDRIRYALSLCTPRGVST